MDKLTNFSYMDLTTHLFRELNFLLEFDIWTFFKQMKWYLVHLTAIAPENQTKKNSKNFFSGIGMA